MGRYVVRRLLQSVLVLWGALTLVFVVVRVVPGDPAALLLGPTATAEQIADARHSLGLDRSIPVQYLAFLNDLLHLNFGDSYRLGSTAMAAVAERLPATLLLAFCALILTIAIGFPLGVWAARHANGAGGRLISVLSLMGQGMPQFWVGIMLILIFAAQLRLLPSSGFTGPASLILPSVSLAFPFIGWLTRSVQDSVLAEMDSHYVRTARSKGFSARYVFYRHVLRNTLVGVITVVGLLLGIFVGNAVIVEVVFSWPGIGRLLIDGITYRDYAVVEAAVGVITAIYIVLNFAIDILYTYIDPRVRLATT